MQSVPAACRVMSLTTIATNNHNIIVIYTSCENSINRLYLFIYNTYEYNNNNHCINIQTYSDVRFTVTRVTNLNRQQIADKYIK